MRLGHFLTTVRMIPRSVLPTISHTTFSLPIRSHLSSNPYVIALLLNLILLILGMIMDMAPIILIATPILLPIATSIGIAPIQFGIMVILNCGIGLLTPPVGSVLFIGSAVAKLPMEKVVKATLPFYLCMLIALMLITFVPQISMWLPSLIMN